MNQLGPRSVRHFANHLPTVLQWMFLCVYIVSASRPTTVRLHKRYTVSEPLSHLYKANNVRESIKGDLLQWMFLCVYIVSASRPTTVRLHKRYTVSEPLSHLDKANNVRESIKGDLLQWMFLCVYIVSASRPTTVRLHKRYTVSEPLSHFYKANNVRESIKGDLLQWMFLCVYIVSASRPTTVRLHKRYTVSEPLSHLDKANNVRESIKGDLDVSLRVHRVCESTDYRQITQEIHSFRTPLSPLQGKQSVYVLGSNELCAFYSAPVDVSLRVHRVCESTDYRQITQEIHSFRTPLSPGQGKQSVYVLGSNELCAFYSAPVDVSLRVHRVCESTDYRQITQEIHSFRTLSHLDKANNVRESIKGDLLQWMFLCVYIVSASRPTTVRLHKRYTVSEPLSHLDKANNVRESIKGDLLQWMFLCVYIVSASRPTTVRLHKRYTVSEPLSHLDKANNVRESIKGDLLQWMFLCVYIVSASRPTTVRLHKRYTVSEPLSHLDKANNVRESIKGDLLQWMFLCVYIVSASRPTTVRLHKRYTVSEPLSHFYKANNVRESIKGDCLEKGGEGRRPPSKPADQWHSSGAIPTPESPAVTPPGTELGSPWRERNQQDELIDKPIRSSHKIRVYKARLQRKFSIAVETKELQMQLHDADQCGLRVRDRTHHRVTSMDDMSNNKNSCSEEDRYTVLQVRQNRRQTADEIATHIKRTIGRPMSRGQATAHKTQELSLTSYSGRVCECVERVTCKHTSNIAERHWFSAPTFQRDSGTDGSYSNEVLIPRVRHILIAVSPELLFMDDNATPIIQRPSLCCGGVKLTDASNNSAAAISATGALGRDASRAHPQPRTEHEQTVHRSQCDHIPEVSMEQHRNASARKTGDPRENPPTNSTVRHDSHVRKSGSGTVVDRTRFASVGGESSLTTAPPRLSRTLEKEKCGGGGELTPRKLVEGPHNSAVVGKVTRSRQSGKVVREDERYPIFCAATLENSFQALNGGLHPAMLLACATGGRERYHACVKSGRAGCQRSRPGTSSTRVEQGVSAHALELLARVCEVSQVEQGVSANALDLLARVCEVSQVEQGVSANALDLLARVCEVSQVEQGVSAHALELLARVCEVSQVEQGFSAHAMELLARGCEVSQVEQGVSANALDLLARVCEVSQVEQGVSAHALELLARVCEVSQVEQGFSAHAMELLARGCEVSQVEQGVSAHALELLARVCEVSQVEQGVSAHAQELLARVCEVSQVGQDVSAHALELLARVCEVSQVGQDVSAHAMELLARVCEVSQVEQGVSAHAQELLARVCEVSQVGQDVSAHALELLARVCEVSQVGQDVSAHALELLARVCEVSQVEQGVSAHALELLARFWMDDRNYCGQSKVRELAKCSGLHYVLETLVSVIVHYDRRGHGSGWGERWGEVWSCTEYPRVNPPTSGFFRHDYHSRTSGSDPAENRTRFVYVCQLPTCRQAPWPSPRFEGKQERFPISGMVLPSFPTQPLALGKGGGVVGKSSAVVPKLISERRASCRHFPVNFGSSPSLAGCACTTRLVQAASHISMCSLLVRDISALFFFFFVGLKRKEDSKQAIHPTVRRADLAMKQYQSTDIEGEVPNERKNTYVSWKPQLELMERTCSRDRQRPPSERRGCAVWTAESPKSTEHMTIHRRKSISTADSSRTRHQKGFVASTALNRRSTVNAWQLENVKQRTDIGAVLHIYHGQPDYREDSSHECVHRPTPSVQLDTASSINIQLCVKRFGRLLTARSWEPMTVSEVNMERRRSEGVGEPGDPREDPPTNGILGKQFPLANDVLIETDRQTDSVPWGILLQGRLLSSVYTHMEILPIYKLSGYCITRSCHWRLLQRVSECRNTVATRPNQFMARYKSIIVNLCMGVEIFVGLLTARSWEPMKVIEIPEKTRRPTASSATIPTYENLASRPGIEPSSPWWEASVLTAQPPRPQIYVYIQRPSETIAMHLDRVTLSLEVSEQHRTLIARPP
ncbi:hypothetical protein PR048_032917 [Dryococelus australis]|uniref:Uncharacterized protein n=1 Tax=Dryococelus australis TaxID=614101 RepID=A0ABQ9G3K0_9NEOP|nr:hypothetical protein PR048_032917 [Dryococelus australis]